MKTNMEHKIKYKVLKFGGSSLSNEKLRQTAAMLVIKCKEEGFEPVVVVSAIGRKGDPYATDSLLNTILSLDPAVPPEPRELDLLLACGEIYSSVIFAHTLKILGHKSKAFRGGQAGIRTDGFYQNARIIGINPMSIVESVHDGFIPVICGFQGLYVPGTGAPGGELTTLGRGGSDTTATAFAAALKAECVEIYTDIDGIKCIHPSILPESPTINSLTYNHLAELAHYGAKVMHPRAVEIASDYQIPIVIKKTSLNQENYSYISNREQTHHPVIGITNTDRLTQITILLDSFPLNQKNEIKSYILGVLRHLSITIHLVQDKENSLSFALPYNHYPKLEEILDGFTISTQQLQSEHAKTSTILIKTKKNDLSRYAIEKKILKKHTHLEIATLPLNTINGCSMVSVIFESEKAKNLCFGKILENIQNLKIEVLQVSESKSAVQILLKESDTQEMAMSLFSLFFEKEKISLI